MKFILFILLILPFVTSKCFIGTWGGNVKPGCDDISQFKNCQKAQNKLDNFIADINKVIYENDGTYNYLDSSDYNVYCELSITCSCLSYRNSYYCENLDAHNKCNKVKDNLNTMLARFDLSFPALDNILLRPPTVECKLSEIYENDHETCYYGADEVFEKYDINNSGNRSVLSIVFILMTVMVVIIN